MNRRAELAGTTGLLLVVAALVLRALFADAGTASLLLGAAGVVLFLVYFFQAGAIFRGFMGRRSTREGGSVFGTALFLLGIVILVNLLGSRFRWNADITADGTFTLAPETVSALEAAPQPPVIWVFHPQGSRAQASMRRLLEGAELAVPSLEFHLVDPDRERAQATEFELTEYSTVVTVGERSARFPGLGEEELVAAVRRASRTDSISVGILSGHGELFPEDPGLTGFETAGRLLHRRGYIVRGVDLTRGAALRDEIDVLVIAAPQFSLSQAETDSVIVFLEGGGRLLALLDPAQDVDLQGVLATVGLGFVPAFLEDPEEQSAQLLLGQDLSGHPVVRDLRVRRVTTLFPGAGEVHRVARREDTRTATLMWTGSGAGVVGRPDLAPTQRGLAMAAERSRGEGEPPARVVLVGDADFATNAYFGTLGNGDLFLAAVRWLSEQDEIVSLRPRVVTDRPVIIRKQQGRALMVLSIVLLPLGVLAWGTAVWWRRR